MLAIILVVRNKGSFYFLYELLVRAPQVVVHRLLQILLLLSKVVVMQLL